MSKTILITGSTDGIGLRTAQVLYAQGHKVILHGRNAKKLEDARLSLLNSGGAGRVETYLADLSKLSDVLELAKEIQDAHQQLDVLINNAGVFVSNGGLTPDGFELRFAVNAIAPFILTKKLLPVLDPTGRVVNLSSAAQAPVDLDGIMQNVSMSDNAAYAQSKLLLTMWSRRLGTSLADQGPVIVSVNPKSFLGSKMVKEAYGVAGGDLNEGADILVRAALSEEFNQASGRYFDNDAGRFANPHPDALNEQKVDEVMAWLNSKLSGFLG